MNIITLLDTKYLRPSRTIEELELINDYKKETCYVYNYEGYHYRYFKNKTSLYNFFKYGLDPELSFEKESELDIFLLTKDIRT